MIHIYGDYSELEAELDRLSDEPSLTTRMELENVLNWGVVLGKAATHVDSGALKASVGSDSNYHAATKNWVGEIFWGGPIPGPSAPVDYAYYERRRGGHHDFTDVLSALDSLWVAAIKRGLAP